MKLPRWRKATWALIVWSVLIIAWVILGVTSRNCGDKDCVLQQTACDIGTSVGVVVIVGLGFMGFVVLSLISLMSRPKVRTCPTCGNDVKKGLTVCESCGYEFAKSEPIR